MNVKINLTIYGEVLPIAINAFKDVCAINVIGDTLEFEADKEEIICEFFNYCTGLLKQNGNIA